jgi:hypothetical protein
VYLYFCLQRRVQNINKIGLGSKADCDETIHNLLMINGIEEKSDNNNILEDYVNYEIRHDYQD